VSIGIKPFARREGDARKVDGDAEFARTAFLAFLRMCRQCLDAGIGARKFGRVAHAAMNDNARPAVSCREFREIAAEKSAGKRAAAMDDGYAPFARLLHGLAHLAVVLEGLERGDGTRKGEPAAEIAEDGRAMAHAVRMCVGKVGGGGTGH